MPPLDQAPRVPGEAGWSAVRVEVADAAADAVANFLVEEGAAGVVTEDVPPVDGIARVLLEAHVPDGDGDRIVDALAAYLRSIATLDPAWTAGPIARAPVPTVDWEAVFRAHHRPLAVGRRLLVAPPWDVPDAPDREVLVVEPGMAFGTGQHATTRTCLEEIEALVDAGGVGSAIDVGTGSGVLAAALARLGVRRVAAFDVDRAVLPLARRNLVGNRAGRVALFCGTTAAVRSRFDLVVANILAETLVGEAAALAGLVAPGGRLVLSGILEEQAPPVLAAFPGWRSTHERTESPWRTLRLERGSA
jgi:ribosomal protein L11 methyltransferase